MQSIAKHHEKRINNFTLLRLISASFVILCHSWDLLKYQNPMSSFLSSLYIHSNLGVLCFFTISGFLITESYVNNDSPIYFLKSRILRIFPGLIFSILVTALLIGPVVTNLSLNEYFSASETFSFIYRNISITYLQMTLPGVFSTNPFPDAVNGSLWTLPLEFRLYLIIFTVGIFGAFKNKKIGTPFLLLLLSIYAYKYYHESYVAFESISCFMIGALFYLLKERVYLSYYLLLILILMFLIVPGIYSSFIAIFLLSYLTFLVAFNTKYQFNFLDKYGDFSYGLYIFAFPVQQLLIYFNPTIKPIVLFITSFMVTLMFAIFSWFFIEKPALSLKKKKFMQVKYNVIKPSV